MTLQEMLNKMEGLIGKKESINDEISELKKRMVIDHAPMAIGDVVKVNGYSHSGKDMIVEGIAFSDSYRGRGFMARGAILKADGKLGKNRGEHLHKV